MDMVSSVRSRAEQRASVVDGELEVAYETMVLGTLRNGSAEGVATILRFLGELVLPHDVTDISFGAAWAPHERPLRQAFARSPRERTSPRPKGEPKGTLDDPMANRGAR